MIAKRHFICKIVFFRVSLLTHNKKSKLIEIPNNNEPNCRKGAFL